MRAYAWFFIILGIFGPVAHAVECDPGVPLSNEEREMLLTKLRISNAGKNILKNFEVQFDSLKNMTLQWDSVSYSQRIPSANRSLASLDEASHRQTVCIYLARQLPEIEHVADLAHELLHATELDEKTLKGEAATADEFVHNRIASRGGEAEAFAFECKVKNEILGDWDAFCKPYVNHNEMDKEKIVKDLYSGELSASLTGEPYPVMLTRQFESLSRKKAYNRSASAQSGLENKSVIH